VASDYEHEKWMEHAVCREKRYSHLDWVPDSMPRESDEIEMYQEACSRCPVQRQCFVRAENQYLEGVWAGHFFVFVGSRRHPPTPTLLQTPRQLLNTVAEVFACDVAS